MESSSLLLSSARVYITPASLSRVEELCQHPIFGKSIKELEISCSYNVASLAEGPTTPFRGHCAGELTVKQELLFEAHEQYRRLYEDQEQVKNGGEYITRICAALSSLSQSLFIAIIDKPNTFPVSTFDLSDTGLMQTCLAASDRKASFTTRILRPPMEMIPELFTTVVVTTIRPTRLEIDFKPP